MKKILLPIEFIILLIGLSIWTIVAMAEITWEKAHGRQVDLADLT